jgi:hypothetical protein
MFPKKQWISVANSLWYYLGKLNKKIHRSQPYIIRFSKQLKVNFYIVKLESHSWFVVKQNMMSKNVKSHLLIYKEKDVFKYKGTSINAVFLSANSPICDWEWSLFIEPMLKFIVILGLFICEFIICESYLTVPIYRI